MADDPYKIAPRTLLLAERAKAERRYSRILSKVLSEIERLLKVRRPKTPSQFMRFWRQIVESPQFDDLCEQASRKIVTMLAVGQKHSWRAAATASSEGRAIYSDILPCLCCENFSIIISRCTMQFAIDHYVLSDVLHCYLRMGKVLLPPMLTPR